MRNLIQEYAHTYPLSDDALAALVKRLPSGFGREDVFIAGRDDNAYVPRVGDVVVDALYGTRGLFVVLETGALAIRTGSANAREYSLAGPSSALLPG